MLEPIKESPVEWGQPLTNWFNNDLVKPRPRYIQVSNESHTCFVPVYVVRNGARMKASQLAFYRNALGINV